MFNLFNKILCLLNSCFALILIVLGLLNFRTVTTGLIAWVIAAELQKVKYTLGMRRTPTFKSMATIYHYGTVQ